MSISRYEFGNWRGIVASHEGRVGAHIWGEDARELDKRVTEIIDTGPVEYHEIEPGLQALLRDYFFGRAVEPALWPVDLKGLPPFNLAVYDEVRRIPRGETATYGEIAALVGSPHAARAVGNALAHNPIPLFVPCHRVRGVGGPGGWSGPVGWKARLMGLEGAGPSMRTDKNTMGVTNK